MIKKYVLFHNACQLGFIDENNQPNIIYFQPWPDKAKVIASLRPKEITFKNIILNISSSKSLWSTDLHDIGYAEHVKAALIQLATE